MMGKQRMPAEIRRAVAEWAAQGFTVLIDMKSGEMKVLPAAHEVQGDPFDQVDMRA